MPGDTADISGQCSVVGETSATRVLAFNDPLPSCVAVAKVFNHTDSPFLNVFFFWCVYVCELLKSSEN